MTENYETTIQNSQYDYQNLLDILREKDAINMNLIEAIKRQEYQIDQLLITAQEKNQQHIRKVKYSSYAPYLIKEKFLIVKLLEYGSDIYLPEYIQLTNFDDIGSVNTPLYHNSSSKAIFQELQTLKKEIGKIVAESPQQIKISKIGPNGEITQFKEQDNNDNISEKSKQFFYNYEPHTDNNKFPSFSNDKSFTNNQQQVRLKKLQQKLLIPQQSKKPKQTKEKQYKSKIDERSKQGRNVLRNKYKVVYIRN